MNYPLSSFMKLYSSEKKLFKLLLVTLILAALFYRIKYGNQSEIIKKRLENVNLEKKPVQYGANNWWVQRVCYY